MMAAELYQKTLTGYEALPGKGRIHVPEQVLQTTSHQ
jgi:hypothetical protein